MELKQKRVCCGRLSLDRAVNIIAIFTAVLWVLTLIFLIGLIVVIIIESNYRIPNHNLLIAFVFDIFAVGLSFTLISYSVISYRDYFYYK